MAANKRVLYVGKLVLLFIKIRQSYTVAVILLNVLRLLLYKQLNSIQLYVIKFP